MKQYIKNGKIKTRQEIVIVKNGMRTINPTENMIFADGWEEYIAPIIETPNGAAVKDNTSEDETYSPLDNTVEIPVPEISDKAAFVRARHKLRNAIYYYDASSEVNIFYINDTPIWLDKVTRTGLMLRFQSEASLGDEMTTLWHNGKQYQLPLSNAINMLYMIEKYASKCYDNTQYHLTEASKLTTVEEIENYDYTTGYPEKLHF